MWSRHSWHHGEVLSGSNGHPRLLRGHRATELLPLSFDDGEMTEGWLQAQLDQYPDLLPINEISSAWGPLISLGREVPLSVGFIDNLYVSPAGEVTVVEAKLWRNPEARRKVVGQILDYTAALAELSYEELEGAVQEATGDERTIWQRVLDSAAAGEARPEATFVDTVSRNLRLGRFLLLVVGDGIRSDLHSIAELVGSHPSLGFHLELVEMRMFAMPDGDGFLAVPALIGRTAEIARVVVDISNATTASVSVVVDTAVDGAPAGPRIASVDEFVSRAADAIGQDRAEAIGDLAE
ncbi:MAG: hypothetical protein M3445_06845 [Actinomycetota bacterium]|nr:hypothetical protein [Actinomycetota bacterium]